MAVRLEPRLLERALKVIYRQLGNPALMLTQLRLSLQLFSIVATLLVASADAMGVDRDASVSSATDAVVKLRAAFAGVRPSQLLKALLIEDVANVGVALPVPMRDGVRLAATVIAPRERTAVPLPTILIRTPYEPSAELSGPIGAKLIPELVRNGYVVAVVNDRGTQWSQGNYHWLKGANRDGYDILEWIIKQPWSNGKVGTFGCSSSAESQLGLATLNHPAHMAMVEMAGATAVGSVPGYHDQGIFYHGGVPDLSWAAWYLIFGHVHHPQIPPDLSQAERVRLVESYSPQPIYNYRFFDPADLPELMSHLPSENILRALDVPSAEWDHLIELSPGSPEWADYDFIRKRDRTAVPGLHVGSWYDELEAYPTVKLFEHLSRNSPNQHLVMGATGHCQMGSETDHTIVGTREVGDARFDYVTMVKGWFDQWLKDISPPVALPPVQYYVLNGSHWETAPAWPPPNTQPVKLFLSSGGHANSLSGDGRLLQIAPAVADSSDTLFYDPLHPVPSPSLGGGWSSEAASEQSSIEARHDVLVYTTDAYSQTLRVVGDINLTLSVSTSVPDTDLMAKLVDVYPDGSAYNLTDTALRLRYRNGVEQPSLMRPGQIYDVVLHGMITATDFLPGHRLRIEIANSNFPNYERNLNSGGRNFDEAVPRQATTQIRHDFRHTSFLELKILPVRHEASTPPQSIRRASQSRISAISH